MKLRVNCVGIVDFLRNGAFMNWVTDVQHQANGRNGDGPDIIVARVLGGRMTMQVIRGWGSSGAGEGLKPQMSLLVGRQAKPDRAAF